MLNAAAVLFNERGVKGATLSDIASSVGLVTNSVTYYYRKKEDLATACLLRTIDAFDALAAAATQEQGTEARITAFFSRLARLLADIELGPPRADRQLQRHPRAAEPARRTGVQRLHRHVSPRARADRRRT